MALAFGLAGKLLEIGLAARAQAVLSYLNGEVRDASLGQHADTLGVLHR